MKKRTNTKLVFNKKTISELQVASILGGAPNTPASLCLLSCKLACRTTTGPRDLGV